MEFQGPQANFEEALQRNTLYISTGFSAAQGTLWVPRALREINKLWFSNPDPWGPVHQHGFTLIPAWISNHISNKVCDEITCTHSQRLHTILIVLFAGKWKVVFIGSYLNNNLLIVQIWNNEYKFYLFSLTNIWKTIVWKRIVHYTPPSMQLPLISLCF